MAAEHDGALRDEIASFRRARAEEAVRRAASKPSAPWGLADLHSIVNSAPSVTDAAEGLAVFLDANEILALILSEDPQLAALGQELAFYLDAEYLEFMATSGNPTLATVAGQAILRALLEAPESES
jgi:hypothetical protein